MAMQLKERAKTNGHAEIGELDLGPAPGAAGRRRMPELASGLFLVAVCALAALWWQTSSTDHQPVLALRNDVDRGQVLTLEDLQVVGVDVDSPVAFLEDVESGQVVGRIAQTDLPAGALVVPHQFSDGSLISPGDGVVGLSLEAGEFPTLSLSTGDTVHVVLTPSVSDPTSFGSEFPADVLVSDATVVEVASVGTSGRLFVSVQVAEEDAARVAAAASAKRVRLIQVSGESE